MIWAGLINASVVFVTQLPPRAVDRLSDFIRIIESAEKAMVALSVFLGTGLGGLFLAWRSIVSRMRDVEKKVEPVKDIAASAGLQITRRDEEHLTNVQRLEEIEREVKSVRGAVDQTVESVAQIVEESARTRDDIAEIRALVLRMLTKQAGLH